MATANPTPEGLIKTSSSTKTKKKDIPIENRLVAIFLAYYMGWGTNCHPAAILILSFSGVYKQTWESIPAAETTYNEAAKILLKCNSFLIPLIISNSFDVYVRYSSIHHSNYDMGYNWFMTLDEASRVCLFKDYSLEEVSQFLHLTQKSHSNFIKTLAGKDARTCATEYVIWHSKYKQIRLTNAQTDRQLGIRKVNKHTHY